jgi:hypothetical protein
MAKPRTTNTLAAIDTPAAAALPAQQNRFGAANMLAIVAALLCIALGYLSRLALNPDGVSYLDLAAAMQRGDWSRFVQGYWSPLFPFITGLIGRATGLTGAVLVPVTHAINVLAAMAGVFILWWWGRAVMPSRPLFGRFALAAFLLCGAGLPRIEAVTPDILALLVAIWLSYELLARSGRRWLLIGALFGVSFLVKTSAWPWLVLAAPLRLWAAPDASARRRVWWSTATCALVMLAWIVPMSIKAGRPTLGSSGRLNYSWYIEASSSRLPDSDNGVNAAYRDVPVGNGQRITVATFDDAAHWTYQPWGDPTAWADKVMSDVAREPTLLELLGYWIRMFGRVFGLWLLPMLLTTTVPAYLLHRRPGVWRELITTQRDALVVGALGLAGLLQFVAIHAEPRLIAPYGIMLALGAMWLDTAQPPAPARTLPSAWRSLLAWVGVATALAFAVPKFSDGIASMSRLNEATKELDAIRTPAAPGQPGPPQVAIIGPAAPALSAAYWTGAHVVMQIPPRSALLLSELPPNQQVAVLKSLFYGRVSVIWKTADDGGLQMFVVPQQ